MGMRDDIWKCNCWTRPDTVSEEHRVLEPFKTSFQLRFTVSYTLLQMCLKRFQIPEERCTSSQVNRAKVGRVRKEREIFTDARPISELISYSHREDLGDGDASPSEDMCRREINLIRARN